MGRYDAHKNPFQYRMNTWAGRRVNESREQEAKSVPCHIVKVEKDFIHVAFENKNGIMTPPVMKMTQNFSRFGREPTQAGDKGHANPGDYYMGGNTSFAGGGTNFYPRGNLSTLSFQPLSNLKAPKRDYDQHHETGGPTGWKVRTMEKQQEGGAGSQGGQSGTGSGSNGGASPAVARAHALAMGQRNFIRPIRAVPTSFGGVFVTPAANGGGGGNGSSGGNGQSQQQKDADEQEKSKTELSFDKDGKVLLQSVDEDNYLYVDQKNKTIQSQSKDKIIHQSEKPEHSVRIDKDHVHIRFEDNRIWVDKNGCYSSKPIQVKQDPYDK